MQPPTPAEAVTPDPCLACSCCAGWVEALEALNASIQHHVASEIRFRPCAPECLICAQIDWQAREAPSG